MCDQTDGCAKQYMCYISYYMMSFLSKSYQIVLGRAIDTPGNLKDVVGVFYAVHKRYLATCFKMRSTTEEDKIDSKRMRVDTMTKKGEVNFAKECKRLLDICYEVGTKGYKKHAKI